MMPPHFIKFYGHAEIFTPPPLDLPFLRVKQVYRRKHHTGNRTLN
jgi:hypothetical protein